MDHRELRGRIKTEFDTQDICANKIGISYTSMSKKLNGTVDFTTSEIYNLIELLHIKDCDIKKIFFTPEVQ